MTDRMNPTDQATPLTQESEDMAEWWRTTPPLMQQPADFAAHLVRIEAAAARRAIEGSGVVERAERLSIVAGYVPMLMSIIRSGERLSEAEERIIRDHLAALPRPEAPRAPHPAWNGDMGPCVCPEHRAENERHLPSARPEEPRVERCPYPHQFGPDGESLCPVHVLCGAPAGTYDGIEGGRPWCVAPCPHRTPEAR